MKKNGTRLAAGICATMLCASASARDAGDWMVRAGGHYIDPKGDNHEVVSVDGAAGLTAAVSYFVTPTLAVDLLVAAPFKHDVELNADGSEVASARHLPPTLSLVWFPEVSFPVKPFIGAGVNYTLFFEEDTKGALSGVKLKLEDSVGVAFVGGLMYDINEHVSVMLDARYFDIDTKAKLDGDSIGDVHIDPWAYGAAIAYRF